MVEPSRAAVDEFRAVLAQLAASLQTFMLYPAGHPSREEANRAVVDGVHAVATELGEPPKLFIARHGFYLGPLLMARESLTFSRLLQAFESAGVEAIELMPTITIEEVDTLTRALLGEEKLKLGGATAVKINHIKPAMGEETERERKVAEMLVTYASGLELVHEASVSLNNEGEVDLNRTRVWVEHIADEVSRDPRQALLITTVKSYDDYTYYHMLNVCLLSIALGFAIGLDREQVVLLGIGGLLHDVGKAKVPLEVLNSPGAPSEEGWRLIQRHPVDGAGMMFVTTKELYHPAASIILEHHAAFDLGGYPSLSGRPHPSLPARIISVADSFDAITSKRPYREPEDRRQALNILFASAGKGYDPRIVRAFARLLGVFPIGSLVRLSNEEVGLVLANHDQLLARPVVRIILDSTGTPTAPFERDLSQRGPTGDYLFSVVKSLTPEELGLDMAELLRAERLEESQMSPLGGLLHEPSFGEAAPEGYVEPHPHPHEAPRLDPQFPPIPE